MFSEPKFIGVSHVITDWGVAVIENGKQVDFIPFESGSPEELAKLEDEEDAEDRSTGTDPQGRQGQGQ